MTRSSYGHHGRNPDLPFCYLETPTPNRAVVITTVMSRL
jgi:hypothetical protein